MGNVLHRATKEYRGSVNTPDFSSTDWILNPDLSLVQGVPSKYWIVTGDAVTLMSQAERDTVDTAQLNEGRDNMANQLDQVEDVLRAFALTVLDELNAHGSKINEILSAIDTANNLAQVKDNIAAVADYPTRTIAQLKTSVRNKLGT